MLLEYYQEFEDQYSYKFLNITLVKQFEKYLADNNIGLEQAFYEVNTFGETLPVTSRTRRNYQTRLRRLVEYACKQEGIKMYLEETEEE